MSLHDFDVTDVVKEIQLYPEGSYQDLALRGFSRDYILKETGFDVGYHNHNLRMLSYVNRDVYRARYVAEHKDRLFIDELLREIANGNNTVQFVCDSCGLGVPSKYSLFTLFDGLGLHDEYVAVRGQGQKAVMRRGCLNKFGTDNVFKLQEYQDIAANTREKKYGAKYTLQNGSVLAEGARATFKEHLQDPEFAQAWQLAKEKSCEKNFGYKYALQSPDIRAEVCRKTREKFGTDYWAQSDIGRKTLSELATVNVAERCNKARQTCLSRYGVEYWVQTEEGRAIAQSVGRRHAAEGMIKLRTAMLNKYGYEYNMQRPEMRAVLREFFREHGKEFAQQARLTCLRRYGVEHWNQTEEGRFRQSQRMLDPLHQQQLIEAKRRNGTLRSSGAEKKAMELLRSVFDNVTFNRIVGDIYSHAVDFYIVNDGVEIFCEINGTWTHNTHWFDSTDAVDMQQLSDWLAEHDDYYDNAANTWSVYDVDKRFDARRNNLNYLVFWDSQHLDDMQLWIAMGCPLAKDWIREYSWLPLHDIDYVDDLLDFEMERCLWNENIPLRRGRLQCVVYAHCYKLYNKLPDQLSDLELLKCVRSLGIV